MVAEVLVIALNAQWAFTRGPGR